MTILMCASVLEYKCFMGLFPEIGRAWLTIDNRLFLWNYEDGCVHSHLEAQIAVGIDP